VRVGVAPYSFHRATISSPTPSSILAACSPRTSHFIPFQKPILVSAHKDVITSCAVSCDGVLVVGGGWASRPWLCVHTSSEIDLRSRRFCPRIACVCANCSRALSFFTHVMSSLSSVPSTPPQPIRHPLPCHKQSHHPEHTAQIMLQRVPPCYCTHRVPPCCVSCRSWWGGSLVAWLVSSTHVFQFLGHIHGFRLKRSEGEGREVVLVADWQPEPYSKCSNQFVPRRSSTPTTFQNSSNFSTFIFIFCLQFRHHTDSSSSFVTR
jgi:hypothetical protein